MAVSPVQASQMKYLRAGGPYELPLQQLREKSILPEEGATPYMEYPKMLRLDEREVTEDRIVDLCDGSKKHVTETRTVYTQVIVNSEEEEERVLAGGKTSVQLEEERQGLLARCSNMNIAADPSWSAVRLRRLLGDALDAPAPGDNMAKLEAELASLRKMKAMQDEIDALRAQIAKPADDIDELRAQLADLGVTADKRWGAARLRDELERATEPREQAA